MAQVKPPAGKDPAEDSGASGVPDRQDVGRQ
jgi:hypothetical protein